MNQRSWSISNVITRIAYLPEADSVLTETNSANSAPFFLRPASRNSVKVIERFACKLLEAFEIAHKTGTNRGEAFPT
jgi:hypothetical protein